MVIVFMYETDNEEIESKMEFADEKIPKELEKILDAHKNNLEEFLGIPVKAVGWRKIQSKT